MMILNLSKIKTEALLILCKDMINSYKDKDEIFFNVDKQSIEFINNTSNDLLKQLNSVTRDNSFYLENKNSYRISAILKAYNYLNKLLNDEFKEGTSFNPAMLCFSMLAMWFKELNHESTSKEYIYFLLYPFSKVYDELLVNVKDEEFKILNIKMIEIAERVMLKYEKISLG